MKVSTYKEASDEHSEAWTCIHSGKRDIVTAFTCHEHHTLVRVQMTTTEARAYAAELLQYADRIESR